VYDRTSKDRFAQVVALDEQKRVQSFGEADYREGSQTSMWITHAVDTIATQIVSGRTMTLKRIVQPPPNHVIVPQSNGHSSDSAEVVG